MQNVKFVIEKFMNRSHFYGKEIAANLNLLENHELIKNEKEEIVFKMKILEEFCNIQHNMHGGATATAIDIATTLAISGLDRTQRHSVSVELSLHYLNPIKLNTNVLLHCRVPKMGKQLAYSYAEIYCEETKKLLVTGNHIKSFLDKTWRE